MSSSTWDTVILSARRRDMAGTKLLYATFLSVTWSLAQSTAPVTEWVRGNAIRLTTVEAGHGFKDMEPLKKVVGNARIVSLGEATHGSREFFQLKHRILEFLATEMGFTIFSIEANMPEAYKLNDFVLKGEGDPATLIKGMYFWTWDTEAVSYTHLRAHETDSYLVCRLLLEKK